MNQGTGSKKIEKKYTFDQVCFHIFIITLLKEEEEERFSLFTNIIDIHILLYLIHKHDSPLEIL